MRLLIVDDHFAVAEAFARALQGEHEVRGILKDHRGVLPWLADHEVDLVLLDGTLPGCDLFELIRKIRHVHHRPRVVVMSMYQGGSDWPGIRRMGAWGIVSKSLGLESFRRALRELMASDTPLPDGEAASRIPTPTSRHLDVLIAIAQGDARKEIETLLNLGEGRIDELISELKHLLHARSWADMVLRAVELGWIEPRVPPPKQPDLPKPPPLDPAPRIHSGPSGI